MGVVSKAGDEEEGREDANEAKATEEPPSTILATLQQCPQLPLVLLPCQSLAIL